MPRPMDCVDNPTQEAQELIQHMIASVDDLPILQRLRIVANLIGDQGGNPGNMGQNPALVAAYGIVEDVMKVLQTYPTAANLVWPNEKPVRCKSVKNITPAAPANE